LTLSADTDGTGPGIAGGTVIFDSLAPPATVTAAPVNIYYNPVSYTAPTDYSKYFTLTEGAALRQYMLVFADGGDKTQDGTTTTTLSGLKGDPIGVTLVAGPGASANFDSPESGTNKQITFSGYTLAGPNAGAYALPFNCCGPIMAHTTGGIWPPPVTPPPPGTPPPGTPPPVTPPPPGTPPGTPLPPPVTTIYTPPPPGVVVSPPPPDTLVVVTPQSPPPVTLSVVSPPKKVPHVVPVLKPKPYRN
jgi:hypothetical protein